MRKTFALYIGFVISLISFIYLGDQLVLNYKVALCECESLINSSFPKAIYTEAHKRITDNNIPYYSGIDERPKPKDITVVTSTDTMYFKRTEEFELKTEEEKELPFLQSVLVWEKTFLKVNDLNKIWSENLESNKILVQTAIKYRHRDFPDTEYSAQDAIFFLKASQIPEYKTGLFNDISIHGYYAITPKTIINYTGNSLVFCSLATALFFIAMVILGILIIKNSIIRLNHLVKSVQEEELKKFRKVECISLNEDLHVDVERGLLRSRDGREASLRPMMIKLLQVFAGSPTLYASNQLLWKEIWDREEDTSNVLTQLIRNFKNETKIFPEITIKSKNRGYELIINSTVPDPTDPINKKETIQ